jgi:hypothetical protein
MKPVLLLLAVSLIARLLALLTFYLAWVGYD